MFILCYGFSTISVKILNDVYGFQAPWFSSFMCATGFILDGFIMWWYAKPGEVKPEVWTSPIYVVASIFASGNVIFTSIALNYLPGSIVMVLKASSVIMTVIEYAGFRGKIYNFYHWVGIGLIVVSVFLIGFYSQTGGTVFKWDALTTWGFSAALIASFTQAMKKTTIKQITKSKTNSLTGMAEGAYVNLLFCTFLSVLFALITGELFYWPELFDIIFRKSGGLYGGLFLVSMGVARGGAFFFQWLIVRNTSATFSQVMTNVRRLLVIIILIVVLKEPTNEFTWWAIGLMIVGMNLYVVGGYVDERRKKSQTVELLQKPTETTPLLTAENLARHDGPLYLAQ